MGLTGPLVEHDCRAFDLIERVEKLGQNNGGVVRAKLLHAL
jgi:hypothetical protein